MNRIEIVLSNVRLGSYLIVDQKMNEVKCKRERWRKVHSESRKNQMNSHGNVTEEMCVVYNINIGELGMYVPVYRITYSIT